MTIRQFDSQVDLIMSDMVDFDVILRIEWISPYHGFLDFFAKIVTLAMSDIPSIV